MREGAIVLAVLCAVLLCAYCSPKIDKNKFQSVNHAAIILQKSITTGVTYQDYGELMQRLSDEVTVLEDTVKSTREKELAEEYFTLLKMYGDGFLLWRYQREFSGHSFVPEGRIYVGQDVEPIVIKYRLDTESHMFGPTRQPWKSVSADSIRVVWHNADEQLKRINTLLKEEG